MSASIIRYRKLITTDVASQAVNLAESGTMGHRVQIPISVDDLNALFVWDRPAGSDRPVGHFNVDTVPFDTILSNSLSKVYTDIDGITNGLNFSSAILDANNDSRVRKGGNVLANDIVMCYVIYKCYGSSSAPTEGVVYNLQDAQDMLSNGALVSAIHTSMSIEESLTNNPGVDKGSIDAMFRDLLAADPSRFFDAAGRQIPGLFETVADTDARGSWCFVENDKIEIAVQMRFVNAVTRQAVGEGEDTTQTVIIPAGSTFKIRLQLLATDTPSGALQKQEVAQANSSAQIVAQAEATAKAAANAATAQRAATQAVSAAAAQNTTAQARYQKAVDDNAKQAQAVAKAQAALKAAQASLNQAIVSGKTSDIQTQRAAALAAEALVENLQAIADIAAADLQNAKLSADLTIATLASAQTASATAASNVATANAAAALAAKAKADDAAVAAAISKAAADAASDPITQAITNAENVVLDPQTLVKLDAVKNDKTFQRFEAQAKESSTQAKLILATQKYNILRYTIDYAISIGKSDSEIQRLRANLTTALAEKTAAHLEHTASLSTLTASFNTESGALSASTQAKKDAAVLSASIAAANVNNATRKLTVATNAFAYASTITAEALDAATQAQATLDSRISGGATFTEIQTRRRAVLDANAFLAERKVALDSANAARLDCQSAVNTAQTAKTAADLRVADVNTEIDYTTTLHQSSMTASLSYQAQKLVDASANQLDLDVTNALVQVNIAKDKSDSANAVYSMAKRNLDAALAGGKRLTEITTLQQITQAAQLEQQRSDVILQEAQANYNKYVPSGSAATAILNSAAEFQSTQIGEAQAVNQAILYNSTLEFYLDSSANLVHAHTADDLMAQNLTAAITGGLTLAQITVLRNQKMDSSNTYAKAMAEFNAASAAMSTVSVGVTENPNVSTILYSAQVLRESEIATAKSNELLRLANEAYTALANIAYKTQFDFQNGEALKDMLATALANGKSLAEISKLQESLNSAKVQYANDILKSEQLSNQYSIFSSQVQADPSLAATLGNSYNVLNYGTVYSRASQNIKDLTAAQISKNTAQTDLASIQAEYDVITEQVNTAIRQGKTTAESASITSTLNGKGAELATKMTILNIANNSLSTAQGNWTRVKNTVFITNDVSSIIQTQDTTYQSIASTLTANVNFLDLSISSAKSNMLTKNLTQTYIDMVNLSTLVTEDNKLYESASDAFNTAIAQGKTLAQIQDLRLKLQQYSAKKVTDSSDLINKTVAYLSSLQTAAQNQDAKGILDVVAQTQVTVLEGAKSNELLRNLIDAKNVAYDLNVQTTAAQSELLLAQSALQIATANGTISEENYNAILTTSSKLATLKNKASAANSAVALANSFVAMNPNVQTLQDLAAAIYEQQNTTAQANILADQYFAAKEAETKTYAALAAARTSLATASALFDTAIASGTDINAIQKARNDLNLAASQLNKANADQNYAKAALNTALVNANFSQTALALITTARVTDDNVVAGANVTTEQHTLNLLNEDLAKAKTVSDASTVANTTAQGLLDTASNTMTEQEIVDLREAAAASAEKASADMQAVRTLQKEVLDQQDVVNKYTVVYQQTQTALAQNTLINYMLFNGFSFQQSINRYVLNKDRLPATVTEGVNIVLYSQTITPIDMGVYSDKASYVIGNLVGFPDDTSAQYMCLVGTDPRGASFSALVGKSPIAAAIAWIQTQGPRFRYRPTDFMIANLTANNSYTVTVPLIGDLAGLKTLFLNSDASGNNTLLNGLKIFGNSVPTSTPANPATILGTSYVDPAGPPSNVIYCLLQMSYINMGLNYSIDGINWTNVQNASLVAIYNGGLASAVKIAYNGSVWVAVGSAADSYATSGTSQGPIIYSTNGLTWAFADISACSVLRGLLAGGVSMGNVSWLNNTWFALGYYYDQNGATKTALVKSSDGIQWTQISEGFNGMIPYSIKYIQNKLYIVGDHANVPGAKYIAVSSDNGTTWSFPDIQGQGYGTIQSISGNSSIIVACTFVNSGYILIYSTDGITWSSNIQLTNAPAGVTVSDIGMNVSEIIFANNIFVASVRPYNYQTGEYRACVITSSDGINWAFQGPTNSYAYSPIKWNGSNGANCKFFMLINSVDDSIIYAISSTDGTQWIKEAFTEDTIKIAIVNDNVSWGKITQGTVPQGDPRGALILTVSQPITFTNTQSVLYIINGKSIMNAAVLQYNTYMTNLVAAGFTPVTTPGNLTASFINTSMLPDPVPLTPFALGTSTITPTLKGVYSPSTSYTTGDIVTDSYGSSYICTVGPDTRGPSYAVTVGNAPVERPGSSIYWYVVDNQSWDALVYNPLTDLQLTPVAFGTGTVFCTSEIPPNPNLQLPASFLTGYTMFGTGIYQRNTITNLSYAYSESTFCYVFTQGETNKDINKTFYVKNGKSALSAYTLNSIFSTLSGILASGASYVNTILSKTSTQDAAATNVNIVTLQTTVLAMQTFYANNTDFLPCINLALSIMNECVKAGQSAQTILDFYLIAVSGGVTGEINDFQSAKTAVATNMTTLVTAMNNASYNYTIQDLVNTQLVLISMQSANIAMATSSTQYAYYYTEPTQIGYTLLDTKNSSGGNFGLPMGTSVRAYIETPTQSNLWAIDSSDYTLEFISIAGDNSNTSGKLVDRFAQPVSGTILMGLNAASNTGVQFALANWGAWRGLLGFNGNANTWGPLYTNSNETVTGTYLANASNYYNFGKWAQNHYCEVRQNNVQTVYLNGTQILQYSTIYSSPSNSVIPNEGAFWQIGGQDTIMGQGQNAWVGGLRNIRLSKEALYTSSFNTSSTIQGPDSVFFKNLECLSTTILLMPMNDSKLLKDYSLSRLRVSTMAFSSNINSNIKYLSSFTSPSSFTSLAISPVCHLPLSSNTSNLGTDAFTPIISGTVNIYSTIHSRCGVLFTGNWNNAITVGFNPISNLTFTYWYYANSDKTGLGLYGNGRTGSVANFYNTNTQPGWWNIDFMDGTLVGGMNVGYGINDGIGNSPNNPRAWNQLGFVLSTNTAGVVYTHAYMNGIFHGSNQQSYGPTAIGYNAMTRLNKITVGRNERNDGQQFPSWDGLFKDVMVFDKALSQKEMLALYTEQLYSGRM